MPVRSAAITSSPPRHPRRPLTSPLRIGFTASVECAPLLVAQQQGWFARAGLDVHLSCEVGLATIREKLATGQLEAAPTVCGMSLTMPLGGHPPPCDVQTAFVFNSHGNAITLAHDLWRRGVRHAADLGKLVRSQSTRLFTFATVSRESTPYFMLCQWLLSAGLDPHRQVRLMVLPPSQMAPSLKAGLIDGFCAGEPWHSLAVAESSGWVVATSEDVLPGHPGMVLLAGPRMMRERAEEHAAVIRILYAAGARCDDPAHRPSVAAVLADSGHWRVPREIFERSLIGPFDDGVGPPRSIPRFHIFHGGDTNRPTLAKARWLARELVTRGSIDPGQATAAIDLAGTVWREDIFTHAIADLAQPPPRSQPTRPAQV